MGDDSLRSAVRERYLAVHGDHPMTAADDAYVREHFVPATREALTLMLDDCLPLPTYLRSDGTPMVPREHGELAGIAGGLERLRPWFLAFWPDDEQAAEREWRAYLEGRHFHLREVSPVRIRQCAERVAEAAAAVEVLRADPTDPIGRGMLGEAVDGVMAVPGLDSLLLPMTAYDRLRLGGPTLREQWVDAPREAFLSPQPPTWPLRTERLVLRPFERGDTAALLDAWASEEWTSLLLSRPMNPAEVGEMVRRRMLPGDGLFVGLVVECDGALVGDSMLHVQGTGLSEGEIGWTLLPEHSGRGLATEAASAVLDLAFDHYGLRRVVANLDARNDRSRALCERLGMRQESHKIADFWSKGEWTDSYEYAILAPEWRARQG